MFRLFKQEPQTDANYQSLLDNLMQTMNSLHLAYENFENATDPELIDSYIYEVNAVQKRYKYLLQEAAKLNLAAETPKAENLCEESPAPLVRQTFREFPFSVG